MKTWCRNQRKIAMFNRIYSRLFAALLLYTLCVAACQNRPEEQHTRKPNDYIKPIPGDSDSIPVKSVEAGKVLISYSDCYTCHKEFQRSAAPSFSDIAKRYPVNNIYIEMLARKIINGGNGSWGYPIMAPHPALSLEDAKMMVSYILSMKE